MHPSWRIGSNKSTELRKACNQQGVAMARVNKSKLNDRGKAPKTFKDGTWRSWRDRFALCTSAEAVMSDMMVAIRVWDISHELLAGETVGFACTSLPSVSSSRQQPVSTCKNPATKAVLLIFSPGLPTA